MSDKDAIYRQDAIDAIMSEPPDAHYPSWYADILWKLPSAEKAQLSEEDATFDCISRQAAIDVEGLDEQIRCEMCRNPMHTNRGCDGNCKYDEKLYERIMQILDERIKPLPSAEPRKKGKWIDKSDDIDGAWNYCSVCMEQAIDLYDFCPNCGADMREGEEDA